MLDHKSPNIVLTSCMYSHMLQSRKHTSCCQACSCANDCGIIGNCCPDFIPDEKVNTIRQGECFPMDTLLNVDRASESNNSEFRVNVLSTQRSQGNYKLVNYCPLSTSSDILKRCTKPKTLEEYTPVSSRDGEKLFRNKYCAYCHGYTKLVFWKLEIGRDCMSLLQVPFLTVDESNAYIISFCIVYARPPSLYVIQKVVCSTQLQSTCYLNNTDPLLQQYKSLCLQSGNKWQNTAYTTTHMQWFKNVYCHLCNFNGYFNKDNNTDQCQPIYPDVGKGVGFINFRLLLNTEHRNMASTGICGISEMYDHVQVFIFIYIFIKQNNMYNDFILL